MPGVLQQGAHMKSYLSSRQIIKNIQSTQNKVELLKRNDKWTVYAHACSQKR